MYLFIHLSICLAQLAGPVTAPGSRGPSSPEIQSFRLGFEMDRVVSLLNLDQTNPGVNSELLYVEERDQTDCHFEFQKKTPNQN